MFLPRRPKNILHFFYERNVLFRILYYLAIFIENNVEVIFIFYIFTSSIDDGFVGIFGPERPEHLVPDDEEYAVVLIKVPRIPAMMHTVVRRRSKKIFRYAKLVYCFGVRTKTVINLSQIQKRIMFSITCINHNNNIHEIYCNNKLSVLYSLFRLYCTKQKKCFVNVSQKQIFLHKRIN